MAEHHASKDNHSSITKYLFIGQAGFLIAALVCILVIPNGLAANDGYSYYGSHLKTIVPYTMGLVFLGWSNFMVAKTMPKSKILRPVKLGLYFIVSMLFVALITPFDHSSTFHWWHVATSIAIFAVQTLIASYLIVFVKWDNWNIFLIGLLVLFGLLGFIYVEPDNGFLIHAELAFQLTYSIILARSLSDVNLPKRSIA